MSLLTVEHLKKVYVTRFGGNKVEALKDVNFNVEQGEYVAIMGESGSGKTTLLNILASLDKPTEGKVILNGTETSKIKENDLAEYRRDHLGFVFQEFNLLDTFSVEDNIFLPMVLARKNHQEMKERLEPLAKKLGIAELLKKYPYEISGGQKQRVAVARALMNHPQIDKEEKEAVMDAVLKDRVCAEIAGLFRIVVTNDRYAEIDSILDYFIGQVKEYRRIGTAYVETPMPLRADQKAAVEKKLLDTTDYATMDVHYAEDPSLIGGMVIRLGDRVIDSSVRAKLNELTKDLQKIQLAHSM